MALSGAGGTLGTVFGARICAPALPSHRVALGQYALPEPGLSETVNGPLMKVLFMAMDEAVRNGVSHACARALLLGHLDTGAVMCDQHRGAFSGAANKAIAFGIPVLMKDNRPRCVDDDEIAARDERII